MSRFVFWVTAVALFSVNAHAEVVPVEIIVKLRGKSIEQARDGLQRGLRTQFKKSMAIERFKTDAHYYLLQLPQGTVVESALESVRQFPDVEFAEINASVHALQEPNDPNFGLQWSIKNTGQTDKKGQVGIPGKDVNVLPVWNAGITGNKDILVALVDTGIDLTHPDLVPNIFTNKGETAGNGVDDDGNGFVDDIHGWNFYKKNNNPTDGYGHGSHVAGIMGAVANNSVGLAGIAWNVTMLPLKALDDSGEGKVSMTVEAINYARMMKAKIINLSWGTWTYSKALEEALAAADREGILLVAAAGNDGNDNDKTPYYPASFTFKNLVTVTATDNQGKLADWCNFGKKSVHIAAPGIWIFSAMKNGSYIIAAGTSMAAPHVVGTAVLMMGAHPQWNAQEVIRRIVSSCEPDPAVSDKVACGGRLNITKAFQLTDF